MKSFLLDDRSDRCQDEIQKLVTTDQEKWRTVEAGNRNETDKGGETNGLAGQIGRRMKIRK